MSNLMRVTRESYSDLEVPLPSKYRTLTPFGGPSRGIGKLSSKITLQTPELSLRTIASVNTPPGAGMLSTDESVITNGSVTPALASKNSPDPLSPESPEPPLSRLLTNLAIVPFRKIGKEIEVMPVLDHRLLKDWADQRHLAIPKQKANPVETRPATVSTLSHTLRHLNGPATPARSTYPGSPVAGPWPPAPTPAR